MNSITQDSNVGSIKSSLIASITINIAIMLIVFAISDVSYETNDDFAISRMISAGYPYVGFVNYFLCRIIIMAQAFLPEFNAFVISQIFFSWLSFCAILTVFFLRDKTAENRIIAIAICTFFSLDHYSSIQFTKTAAILMTAGLLMIVDDYIHKRKIVSFILGFFLFYIGVAFRQKGMFPAMAYAAFFLATYIAGDIIKQKKQHSSVACKNRRREIAVIFVLLIIVMAPYGTDKISDSINEGTPELKLAREYQAERRLITDYPILKYYEDRQEEFEDIGISENDLYLMTRWIFDYDGAATLVNMKAINEITKSSINNKSIIRAIKKTGRESLKSIANIDFTGAHILIAFMVAIYMLVANTRKSWVHIIIVGMLSLLIYVSIYYMQRPQYRALYIADESAVFWLLYASGIGKKTERPKQRKYASFLIIVLIITMFFPATHNLKELNEHNKSQIIGDTVVNYFNDNPHWFFIGPTTSMGMTPGFETPLRKARSIENMADTGGWDTLTPYRLSLLESGGIKNPVKDLLKNPNAVFFGDSKIRELREYYKKWYCSDNEEVIFEKIDAVNGNNIYRVYSSENID